MTVLAGGVLWSSGVVVLIQKLRSERLARLLLPATVFLLMALSVLSVLAAVRSVLPVLFVAWGYCLVASQTADQASEGLKRAFKKMGETAGKKFVLLTQFVLGNAAWEAMVKRSTSD